MDFNCPKCRLAGRIDDAKLPEQGLYATCPKCKERFLVKREPAPTTPPERPETASPAAGPVSAVRRDVSQDQGYTAEGRPGRHERGERPSAGYGARSGASVAADDDLETFVGKNSDKYLRKFANFNTGGNDGFAVTWHWPAFFVPFWWLIYRKQYAWAVLAFFLSFIPYVGLLSMIAFGLTGNYIYYSYTRKKLNEIRVMPSEMTRAVEMARAGGVNNIALVLAPLIGIALLGIIAAIAIPQFAAYRMKGFNAGAISELKNARMCVDNYYAEHKAYPDSLEQANYKQQVQDIDVHFNDRAPDRYTIVATHLRGDKEFAARSDVPDLLCRPAKEKDSEYVPLK